MELFTSGAIKDIHIIQLGRGELLLESVCKAIEDLKLIDAIILSAVGSLQRLVYHQPVTVLEGNVQETTSIVEQPMEILSLSGTIINKDPHFHIIASSEQRLYGGHLKMGTIVLSIAEITVATVEGFNVERRMGPHNQRKLFSRFGTNLS